MKRSRQLSLAFDEPRPKGRRGVGRPRKEGSISHRARPVFDGGRSPVHVTLRMARTTPNLRSQRGFRCVEHALREEARRGELRVVHYSVQGNHVHLVVEADDRVVLARRMQGFSIRLARRINRDVMRHKRGTVLGQRYHARVLSTPSEVRHAIGYVLFNHTHHGSAADRMQLDPFSSARTFMHFAHAVRIPRWSPGTGPPPLSKPSTWLLRGGFRRAGLVENRFA